MSRLELEASILVQSAYCIFWNGGQIYDVFVWRVWTVNVTSDEVHFTSFYSIRISFAHFLPISNRSFLYKVIHMRRTLFAFFIQYGLGFKFLSLTLCHIKCWLFELLYFIHFLGFKSDIVQCAPQAILNVEQFDEVKNGLFCVSGRRPLWRIIFHFYVFHSTLVCSFHSKWGYFPLQPSFLDFDSRGDIMW